ncbi:MAG: response regulator [Candidatus Omnitrophota bacterium]
MAENKNTILIVDDDIGPRQALRFILQDNYHVLTCEDTQQALNAVANNEIDLVLLDIRMPKMDGLELLKAMKLINPNLEAVFVTAYPNTESAITAMEYGAYDYIVKPFDKEKIEEVVKKGIMLKTQKELKRNMPLNLASSILKKLSPKKSNS